MTALAALLDGTPYLAYAYAYPHKTAYRHVFPPVALGDLWAGERREALFLYLHVPFCEMRCGFCNLFTTANPAGDLVTAYLDTFERQARQVATALGPAAFARLAIGGGTPTFLTPAELERLFDLTGQVFGVEPPAIPVSVETSPQTATPDRLRLLRARGVDRISIGVQSFVEAEVAAVGRAQRTAAVEQALGQIRAAGFPTLNVDLIYGLPGQTVATWLASLERALCFAPEEIYLYPLYIRPLTGLDRLARAEDDLRLACYRAGRERLIAAGYTQVSMRFFRAAQAPTADGPVYCCQDDGMVGLGCGARSYTRAHHYSNEYAVGVRGVRAILADYITQPDAAFDVADYGVTLDDEDQRRRYVLKSLLRADGLSLADYRARFGGNVFDDLAELTDLIEHGLATLTDGLLQPTPAGLERSDTIGDWLVSARVRGLMAEYEPR